MKRSKLKKRRPRLSVYRNAETELSGLKPGELLLEHFSDAQCLAWKGQAGVIQEYHYRWWYELVAQQALANEEIIGALKSCVPIRQDLAGWGRAIRYKYSNSPLSAVGSLRWVGGRFNYGHDIDRAHYAPFPALYMAEDAETGLREMHGLSREHGRGGLSAEEMALASKGSFSWVAIEGRVTNVFDLTTTDHLEGLVAVLSGFALSRRVRDIEEKYGLAPLTLLQTSNQLLQSFMMEDWRQYPSQFNTPANSQVFATWLIQAGFEGVKYISTKAGKANIAVFTRQLENSSSVISVVDPPAAATHCRLDRDNFKEAESS